MDSTGTADAGPDQLQELMARETLAEVSAEARLTALEHEALMLDAEGYTDAEIAAKQHVEPGTIYARLSKARTKVGEARARLRAQDSA